MPFTDRTDETAARLQATTDAQVWAKEWCYMARLRRDQGGALIDEDWMIGWFADAIEVGRDAMRRAAGL